MRKLRLLPLTSYRLFLDKFPKEAFTSLHSVGDVVTSCNRSLKFTNPTHSPDEQDLHKGFSIVQFQQDPYGGIFRY